MVKPPQPTVVPTVRLLRRLFRRFDRPLFLLWAALCTLSSARMFYGYMLKQTEGEWSAPLDDVFIHFDYARATALGHPFEWTIGNGYSSGNTSLTYPFVLAIFPTWGGPIPSWFTSETMRVFPVEGNVICGGYEQNVYRADWHLLGTGQDTRFPLPKGEKIRVNLDVAGRHLGVPHLRVALTDLAFDEDHGLLAQ